MANAGCINAIGFDGTYLRTLQCLDSSNIGVGVQYTAPNPLDDKRFDYITYTDKCGCQCCLTDENEILIYATQGVIKNLTLTNDDENEAVIVKWTDLFGSNWNKTVVRYKTGSYPSSPTDGTLAVEETTQNQYQTNGYSVTGLTDGTTYYFSVFALDGDGTTINVQSMSIVPDFVKRYTPNSNTKVYIPMDTDLLDHGPNNISVTNNYNVAITTLSGVKFNVADFHNTSQRYLTFTNIDNMSGAWTVSVRARIDTGRLEDQWLFTQGTGANNRGLHLGYSTGTRGLVFGLFSNDADTENSQWQDNTWHNYTFTWNGSTGYNIIVDGVSVKSGTLTSGFYSGNNTGYIGQQSFATTPSSVVFKGYMSEFFIETGQWTVAQTLQYVNNTKKNYGIA